MKSKNLKNETTLENSEIITTPVGRGGRLRVRTEPGAEPSIKIIHDNPLRLGKDEMNLIEHPFAALWQKEPGNSVIFYDWTARHPITGQSLPASWMVAGHTKHGLPTANDERVYLVLMELTREAGFTQTVHFSRYDVLNRLGWGDKQQSYQMLEAALNRLQGVTVNANNAFWNPKSKTYLNTAFNILDHFAISAEKRGRKKTSQPELPISFFKWSDVMFQSFQSGYIRTLDLGFALELKGDIALRLYRYLDKKVFDGRPNFDINLAHLCVGHLGMKPSPYPSKLKERLQPAHTELIERGFLHSVEYLPDRKKEVKVRYIFAERHTAIPSENGQLKSLTNPSEIAGDSAVALPSMIPVIEESLSLPFANAEMLSNQMLELGVSPDVVREFLETVPLETLQHQLHCLPNRSPRDTAAVFVKAVRGNWTAPANYKKRKSSAKTDTTNTLPGRIPDKTHTPTKPIDNRASNSSSELENARLDALWEKLDERTKDRLNQEAQQRLGILGRVGDNSGALQAMRRNLLRETLITK